MGNGIKPYSGQSGAPVAGPMAQENVQDTDKLKDGKVEAQPVAQPKAEPPVTNPSGQKLEQRMNGTARQAQLQAQLQKKTQPGESMDAARKILDNPKLSNEAKVAELQKMLGKTDKAEFARFMSSYTSLSDTQRQMINSAITESPKIMERVGTELPQKEQLAIIKESVMNPMHGTNEKEEKKRLERADKGIGAWMQGTDVDTLNKALEGKNLEDIKVAGKLFGVMASDPARLVMGMGHHQGKIQGDSLEVATEVMRAAMDPKRSPTRDEIEGLAQSMIVHNMQEELKRNSRNLRQ